MNTKTWALGALALLCGAVFISFFFISREFAISPASQMATVSGAGSGLVAHYTFDEGSGTVAADSSGGNVNGSLTGPATWVSGRVGGAVDLTASSASVNFGASPAYIENKSALTIAFWMRAGSNPPAYVPIFHNQVNSSQVTFQIVRSSSGTLEFKVFTSSNATANSANDATSGSGWHHVVGVYDGSQLYLYVNGLRSGNAIAQTGSTKDTYGPLLLLNGSFDDVRIYNRALSASEVTELYTYLGSSGSATVPPPVAPNPINGICGLTQNSCTVGSLSNPSQSSTQYQWSCLGSNGGINASCSLDMPPVSGGGTPSPGAPAGTCSTVSYFSRNTSTEIKWTFDKAYTCGQFANGDWWIVGPAVITAITPNYTGKYHGWEVNPLPTGAQGFDGRNNLSFSSGKVPSLPYTAKPGDSVVKAVSRNLANENCEYSDRPCLLTAAVLTVLDSVPPDNGATIFRPPYVGVSKPLYSVNDLRLDLLPSLPRVPLAGSSDMAAIKSRFRPLQLDHLSFGYGRVLRPVENLPDYGGDIGRDTNSAILKLMLDYPIEQKKDALIPLIQYGIDLYQMHINGHTWNQGGLTTGRRPLLAFTTTMLDRAGMKNLLKSNKYNGLGGSQAFVEDAKIQRGKGGVALYGDPESGEYAYWSTLASNGTRGDKMISDPYGYIDGGARPGDNYTNIIAPAMKAATMIAHLMPSIKDAWHQTELKEMIDYADRYYTFGLWALPDPCAPYSGNMSDYGIKFGSNGSGGCITGSGRYPSSHGAVPPADSGVYGSSFVTQMWNTYRTYASGGFTPSPLPTTPTPTTPTPTTPTPNPATPNPATPAQTTPTNGSCSGSLNECFTGTFQDQTDTSSNFLWSCAGINGGITAYCSMGVGALLPPSYQTEFTGTGNVSMSLLGNNPSYIQKGTSFIDPGVKVEGSRDNIFKIKAKVNGKDVGTINDISVSNLPMGEHTIAYTVTDSDGNTVTAERKLIINRTGTYEKPAVTTNGANSATATNQSTAATNSPKYTFTKSLRLGQRGEEVRQLQIFLNNNGFKIAETGTGSPGNETTYFGPATLRALAKFQEAYAADILTPGGLTRGSGIFGPRTIKKINSL